MNKENKTLRTVLKILSYVLVAAIAVGLTLGVTAFNQGKLATLALIIDRYFVDDYDKGAVEDAAASAMVDALGNRWSYYIPASEYAAYIERQNNSYVGIGITISPLADNKGLEILRVEPGSGALDAGLQPGDVVIAVNGQGMDVLSVDNAKTLVQGEPGTTVEITVLRNGKEQNFTVERRYIQLEVATGELLNGNVGYIKINNFNSRCAQETIALIEKLRAEGATSLLFDVRFNPGGYKDEMVKILDYLLPEGDLFRSVDYAGNEETDRSDEKNLKMPMAVLINRDSYSAAEFFAAALREYDWATLVGEATTGKSHFQITMELGDGSAVNLSVGKYLTPKGVSLADVGGLQPDKTMAVDDATYAKLYSAQIPWEEDAQLLAALDILKTAQ